jgi:hypothetical protein
MMRAVLRTLRKVWDADFTPSVAGRVGHRRIAEVALVASEVAFAFGNDDAATLEPMTFGL